VRFGRRNLSSVIIRSTRQCDDEANLHMSSDGMARPMQPVQPVHMIGRSLVACEKSQVNPRQVCAPAHGFKYSDQITALPGGTLLVC
jgi:hypothetical protein